MAEPGREMPVAGSEPETGSQRAHRLASAIAQRFSEGTTLGRPSVYNAAREVLVEEFDG